MEKLMLVIIAIGLIAAIGTIAFDKAKSEKA